MIAMYQRHMVIVVVFCLCVVVYWVVSPTIVAYRFRHLVNQGDFNRSNEMLHSGSTLLFSDDPTENPTAANMKVTIVPLTFYHCFRGERWVFVEIPACNYGAMNDRFIHVRSDFTGLKFVYEIN